MDTKRIEFLTTGWDIMTCKVIHLFKIDLTELQDLLKESYELLHERSQEDLIPKAATGLLCEMQEFSWQVSDLKDTPLHKHHQPIVSVVNTIKDDFLSGNADASINVSAASLLNATNPLMLESSLFYSESEPTDSIEQFY